MAGCKPESWTVKELSDALQNNHKENKRIVVPMFQRGERWKKNQQQTFIDSLIKGYPVGTLLFYEKIENNQVIYILVDGLQRGSCIRSYMTNPTEFFYNDNISDDVCSAILSIIGEDDQNNYDTVKLMLTDYIKEQKSFKNIQFFNIANAICQKFEKEINSEDIGQIIEKITNFFEDKQDLYDSIAKTTIPVNVYSGPEETLPEIFERINSKGTPLDQYEIYAAAWPVNKKFTIINSEVIEYVVKKYDTLIDAGFTMDGYNREELRKEKRVNAFEYLFGLSKYLVNTYDILAFNTKITDDAVNPLAFELVNACLNDKDKIKVLYKNLEDIDINAFESALLKAIEFVTESVSLITSFKGNVRKVKKTFHSKYQIMSMISTSFKEMYPSRAFDKIDDLWEDKKKEFARNLVQYYVYDIITKYWNDGGPSKIHLTAKTDRYKTELSGRAWAAALDSFFELSMRRSEKTNVANPKSEEYVLLNCIYVKTFSAMDQLSADKFDVEHIVPKKQIKEMIEACNGDGLPVSCIANLCYLPESTNRSKGSKTFYQDKKYLAHINLSEVESKYSFTEQDDLEWMDMPYEKPEDFDVLKEYYFDYCTKRFKKLKHLFCDSLSIPFVSSEEIEEEKAEEMVIPIKQKKQRTTVKIDDKYVQRLVENAGEDLIKKGKKSYLTRSEEIGYALTTSKTYKQGDREKFWFAYRRNTKIKNCKNQYYVFGCKDETTMIKLPVSIIEDKLEKLNSSKDEDGNITHWHMVFFKDASGHMTWLLSRPKIEEINVDKFLM